MSRSTSVLFVLVLLAVAMTTTQVAGNNICRVARYTKQLNVNGRVRTVQAGKCIVRDNYNIQPKFLGHDEDVDRDDFNLNSFRVTNQECCCRVGLYILKTVHFGSAHVKYKDIQSCTCQAC